MQQSLEIFFATDDNFVPHLCTAIASILENANNDDNFNFYVMTKGLMKDNIDAIEGLKKIKNFNLEIINVDNEKFKNFVSPSYINSNATFYRYLIPDLKPELDKVLYLDCDIIAKTSLSSLWRVDLEDNYIAGVEDCHPDCAFAKISPLFDLNEPYLNAGVLLFNCKKMREDKISEKCFNLTDKLERRTYFGADQDVLNILTQGKKMLLHPKYNVISAIFNKRIITVYTKQQINEAINNPVIIHFTDKIKPWTMQRFPLNDYSFEYFKYLKKTPFYNPNEKYKLLYKNGKVSKAINKLTKNQVIKTMFYLLILPIDLIGLVLSFLHGIKLIQEFDKRTQK